MGTPSRRPRRRSRKPTNNSTVRARDGPRDRRGPADAEGTRRLSIAVAILAWPAYVNWGRVVALAMKTIMWFFITFPLLWLLFLLLGACEAAAGHSFF